MTTTAKIAAKGCNDTGITEDLAASLHNQLGKKVLAIVELVAEARSEKRNGDESVALSIITVEPAPDHMTEDHLRELARAFHYERQLADGQLTIDSADDIEPKVSQVLAAGQRHRPHPFLPADAALDNPICDICGVIETGTALHTELDDEDLVDENDDQAQLELDSKEPHEYESGPDDSCLHCGQAEHEDYAAERRHLNTVPDPFLPAS